MEAKQAVRDEAQALRDASIAAGLRACSADIAAGVRQLVDDECVALRRCWLEMEAEVDSAVAPSQKSGLGAEAGVVDAEVDEAGVVDREAVEELLEVLVQHRVMRDVVVELLQLGGARQLLVQQQPHHLDEVGLLRQLLNRISGITQNALLTVQERDVGLTGAGITQARVEGHGARGRTQLGDIDRNFTFATHHDWQIQFMVSNGELGSLRRYFLGHRSLAATVFGTS